MHITCTLNKWTTIVRVKYPTTKTYRYLYGREKKSILTRGVFYGFCDSYSELVTLLDFCNHVELQLHDLVKYNIELNNLPTIAPHKKKELGQVTY